MVNREQLSLYFGIGRYISEHSREGYWGTGAIASISEQLQRELPGLRGFGERQLKNMRTFYEVWSDYFKSVATAADLLEDDNQGDVDLSTLQSAIRSPLATELNLDEFVNLSFTHHCEILVKTKDFQERIFYIHQTYINKWDKYKLRDLLKADLYHHQGQLPNNFAKTIPASKNAIRAI